jgi:hypothetical protein
MRGRLTALLNDRGVEARDGFRMRAPCRRLWRGSQGGRPHPATVRAIFPGASYMVVTDSRQTGMFVSYWNNPFIAGQPTAIAKFAIPGSPHQ